MYIFTVNIPSHIQRQDNILGSHVTYIGILLFQSRAPFCLVFSLLIYFHSFYSAHFSFVSFLPCPSVICCNSKVSHPSIQTCIHNLSSVRVNPWISVRETFLTDAFQKAQKRIKDYERREQGIYLNPLQTDGLQLQFLPL